MHNHYVYSPAPNQSLGIMQPMNPAFGPMQAPGNPIVDVLVPSDYSTPVEDIAPYGPSEQVGMGSVQDAIAVLSVTDLLFGG